MVPFQGVSRTVANQSSLGVVNVVPFEDFATSCTEGRKFFQNHHNVIPSLLGMSKHVLAPVGISFDVMACCACAFLMQCAWKSRQDCCRICMWIYYIYIYIYMCPLGPPKTGAYFDESMLDDDLGLCWVSSVDDVTSQTKASWTTHE